MKYHKWSKEDDALIQSGKPNQEIAQELGLSLSKVISRKCYLTRSDAGFESVLSSKRMTAGEKAARTRKLNKLKAKVMEVDTLPIVEKNRPNRFLVNGLAIEVSGDIKNVLISKEEIKIKY